MPADELVYLKLGGSLITDKTAEERLRPAVLERLANEIRQAMDARPGLRLLLGHGSGSFGHFAGRKHGTRQGIQSGREAECWAGYAETGAAAARLDRHVVEALLTAGVPAVPFPPSASARCAGGRLADLAWQPIAEALERRLLPVVYGDVALDCEQGCTIVSTEEVFACLLGHIPPARILLAGTVDGVFTADPLRDPAALRLPHIDAEGDVAWAGLGASHGVDVTGGMQSKVAEMAALVRAYPGLIVHILSGKTPGAIAGALVDPDYPAGTRVLSLRRRGATTAWEQLGGTP